MVTTAISILNWNGEALTKACLASLEMADVLQSADIYILDNGSSVNEAETLQRAVTSEQIRIRRNEVNLGFAEGHNEQLRFIANQSSSTGHSYTHYILLNQDAVVNAGWLEALISAAELHPTAAAIGCAVKNSTPNGGGATIQSFGGSVSMLTGKVTSHLAMRPLVELPADVTSTEIVLGNCMLIPRVAWETVGEFKPYYFAYYEEADWCVRATELGFSLAVTPHTVITHSKSGGFRTYWIVRNMIYFEREHAAWWQLPFFAVYQLTYFFIERLRKGSSAIDFLRATRDGWLTSLPK